MIKTFSFCHQLDWHCLKECATVTSCLELVWSSSANLFTSYPDQKVQSDPCALHQFLIRCDTSPSSGATFWTASSKRLSSWVSVFKAQPEHSGIFITGYNYAEGEVCVYPCLWEEPKVWPSTEGSNDTLTERLGVPFVLLFRGKLPQSALLNSFIHSLSSDSLHL